MAKPMQTDHSEHKNHNMDQTAQSGLPSSSAPLTPPTGMEPTTTAAPTDTPPVGMEPPATPPAPTDKPQIGEDGAPIINPVFTPPAPTDVPPPVGMEPPATPPAPTDTPPGGAPTPMDIPPVGMEPPATPPAPMDVPPAGAPPVAPPVAPSPAPTDTPPTGVDSPITLDQTGVQTLVSLLNDIKSVGMVETPGTPLNGTADNDLLVGSAENDTIRGKDGNDVILGNKGADTLFGDAGTDALMGGDGDDDLRGGSGDDTLSGDAGGDILVGDAGVDRLTGGEGRDNFTFTGDVFANGPTAPAGETGINVLNKPDVITDFTFGDDQFAFNKFDLNIDKFTFQQGKSSEISGDGNLIVLTDPFAAAGAAAKAIAANDNIKSHEGAFVYFNSTLGLTRLVYSQDLSNGGDISVLANLENQKGDEGLANLNKFTANDFMLV